VVNSSISFNVTEFFTLSVYTVFGFIVLALLTLSYYYFSQFLFRVIQRAFPNLFHLYLAIAIIGLVFLTIRSGEAVVLFYLPVLLWLVIYTLFLSQESFIINRFKTTIAGILFWIFIFSASLALLVLNGNREKELRQRKGIAEKYDQLSDPSREDMLSIASTYLDNRYLKTNFYRFYLEGQNRKIRDSIMTGFFANNPYHLQIYVFDEANNPVNNEDGRSFVELNTLFSIQGKPMGLQDLSFVETSYDRFTYILKRTVSDTTAFVGTFFILATPKQFENAEAPYPEIFSQTNVNDPENSPFYSYAIYIDTVLRNHSSKYAFPVSIRKSQIPTSETVLKEHSDESGDYDELWYRAGNNKVVIVAKKQDSLVESITLFSYLFCAFLIMVGLLQLFGFLLKLARSRKSANLFSKVTIRTQIHGTIIFISVLSFIIIGIATISFFIGRYNRNNADRLSRTAVVTVKEMNKRLSEGNVLGSGFSFADSATMSGLQSLVREIADVHDIDANVYDLQGRLQVSSYDEVYARGILSTQMHPLAYYHLKNLNQVQRVQKETISSLSYLSIYTAIRNDNGDVYAYLNIPFFSSEFDLKQEISNFFVTIINLNALIFLIAGIIALFITNRITRSFSLIGDKMKEITLGKVAEEIVWTKDDEIGELVTQYNKMVHQLEESAEVLAKSEREGAWREMARQVAHEIKNPLTPMKLSIQYLQKSIQNNQPNVQQLTTNVATTLIEQIDHLSKIAADFSQFANIGNKKLEKMDLHSVIGSLVDLYSANPRMELVWNKVPDILLMRTDKTHMNRLFTNLLSNAVDACSERRQCVVTINEVLKDDFVIISITDNGEGIPEEMQSKIFTPNFTTKTSGTGLGLAMCKSIVEQAGGSIWFETVEEKGTTFFVELPLS
jgi:signal transduction histidine kinase